MTGHIAGLGYSQRSDANGRPLSGCKLYIYETGTSTPASTYSDYSLSTAHSHPIVADSAGVIPMFWVADGTYRVRLTDSAGNEVFDDDGIVAIGPSSGSGGGGTSVDTNAIAATGDFSWQPVSGTRSGWVRANGRTIGSVASGGTERANADCENLFLFLWNTFSNSLCAVTGGRGGSAAADWAANKVIATLDMRSRLAYGLDDMGNTAAGVTGASTSAAAAIGASTVAITVAQANLPNITLTSSNLDVNISAPATFSLSVNSSISNGSNVVRNLNTQSISNGGGAARTGIDSFDTDTLSLSSNTITGSITVTPTGDVSGTVPLGGSGTAISTTIQNRARVGTWYIRL